MNERSAIQLVEQTHGSMEDFVVHLLEDCPDALDEMLPLVKRAEAAGLPLPVFSRLLSSGQFRQIIRGELVNRTYTLLDERDHIEAVKKVAINHARTVATAKGEVVEVDQNPADVMQAGRYLNEARGTPMESKGSGGFGGITIIIGHADRGDSDDRTIEVDAQVVPGQHRPGKAGQLPPPGVLARSGVAARLGPGERPAPDPSVGAFYGSEAEEEDEDHAIAEKVSGRPQRGGVNGERSEPPGVPLGYRERSAKWQSLPTKPRQHAGSDAAATATASRRSRLDD
jgi:hypothetical protein